jgi:hypothetical protein
MAFGFNSRVGPDILFHVDAVMTGAYSFVCECSSTDALCARLNQVAWQWRVGDSHWYGDYVAAVPFPGVRIRIVDFPKRVGDRWRYESDIRLGKDCKTPMAEIDAAYRKVLAQLPAHDIQEIEGFD